MRSEPDGHSTGRRPSVSQSSPLSGAQYPFAGPWSRRDLLRVGSLGLSASLLGGHAAATARADDSSTPAPTAKSVIFLWMAGGVTQLESFDPKPQAPEEIRGTLKAIDTSLPGVQFCETMPCLAKIAHKIAVVRSFSHDNNDHFQSQAYGLSGRKVPMTQILTEPNIGSIVTYLQGPRNNLPGYIAVPGTTFPGPPPHNLFVGGWLGDQYAPFAVGGTPAEPDFTVHPERWKDPPLEYTESLSPPALDFLAGLNVDRVDARLRLRRALDQGFRGSEQVLRAAERRAPVDVLEHHYENAHQLLASASVRDAFDLSTEPQSLRDDYGRSKIGGRCLLARRLVEAGARFVMVDYGYDHDYGNLWDNHNAPGQFFPHVSELAARPYHVAGMDRAFAALVNDLEQRGLLQSTLIVYMTEFGRTPKINSLGGRDHWGPAGSIMFAGGGTKAGQVIGATDKQSAYPVTVPHSPGDVAATIYRAIGINPDTMLQDKQGRPLPVLPEGRVIPELFG